MQHNNDTPRRDPAEHYAKALGAAKFWSRISKLAGITEDRAHAEGQAAHYYSEAARWEAQAETESTRR